MKIDILWATCLAIIAIGDVFAIKTFEGTWTALVFGGCFCAAVFPIISSLGGEE